MFWAKVVDLSSGSSRQSRLRLKEERFLEMEVPLPPLSEQERLVGLIESVSSRLSEARRLRQSIEAEREEMLRACARELARNAPRRPLQQVAPITRRPVTIDKTKTYREVGVRSFGRGLFEKPLVNGADLTWERPCWMKSGDLLLSNIKAWEGAVSVITDQYDDFIGSHRYITCRPDPMQATPEFLCQWLLTQDGLRHLGGSSPGATDRNRTLGLKKLMVIPVPVPALAEQKRLTRLSHRAAAAADTQTAVSKELEELMPSLLDRAFAGGL
jgi:type I restriction enzyme S subunit